MIKRHLELSLNRALEGSVFELETVCLERPKNPEHGDYALNYPFRLAKKLRQAPNKIAQDLAFFLSDSSQLAGYDFIPIGGYVNIRLQQAMIMTAFSSPSGSDFPVSKESILLEYVSANPTGPLHIGHGRWAVLGSVIQNLLQEIHVSVATEFYINDAGTQIDHFYRSVDAVKKGEPIPETGYHGDYVQTLAQQREDPLKVMIAEQKRVLDSLGVRFDAWFSEKSLHASGAILSVLATLKEKELSYEEEGALWFRTTQFGDEKDRVLIKKDGGYTYFLVDIAYHKNKLDRCDSLLNIWGADHHGYIARVRAAVMALSGIPKETISAHFQVVLGQLVTLMRQGEVVRMSKRTGNMVTLEEVIDEIGVDATRFFLIQKSPDTALEFDLDLAKKQSSDNPVYYLQYAHARLCSILKKSGFDFHTESEELLRQHFLLFDRSALTDSERSLLLYVLQMDDELYKAARQFEPHILVQYCLELAKRFHYFYQTCPILTAEKEKESRLFILLQVKKTLFRCFHLLGISAPESM